MSKGIEVDPSTLLQGIETPPEVQAHQNKDTRIQGTELASMTVEVLDISALHQQIE